MKHLISNPTYNYHGDSIINLNIYIGEQYNLIVAEENIYDNLRNITEDVVMLIGRLCRQYNLDFHKTIYVEHYLDIPMHNTRYPLTYNYAEFKYTVAEGVHDIIWYPIYRDEVELLTKGKIILKDDLYHNSIPHKQIHQSLGYIAIRTKYRTNKNN